MTAGTHSIVPEPTRPTVAFLGPVASYSHQATQAGFSDVHWRLEPTNTIKDVFEAVHAGRATYGVVPFENSTHGTVTFTLDCLADRHGGYGGDDPLAVCGEIYLDVHHYLIGRLRRGGWRQQQQERPRRRQEPITQPGTAPGDTSPGRGQPLASLAHVRRVLSHPQSFGQTADFFARHLRGVETVDVSSTSRAAELVAAAVSREDEEEGGGRGGGGGGGGGGREIIEGGGGGGDGGDDSGDDYCCSSAAVASEMAARLYGLDVLAPCIEDREDNATRFFIIGTGRNGQGGTNPGLARGSQGGGGGGGGGGASSYDGASANTTGRDPYGSSYKSMASFTVPHGTPGALADVLDCFRRRGLNLTSINSLPSWKSPFQYLFLVEFSGSRHDDPDGKVAGVLEDAQRVAQEWRWLGSWENQRR